VLYGEYDEYSGGKFDLATWACELSAYTPFKDEDHLMSRQCVAEGGALWIGLLLVLFNVGIAGLVWWDRRKGRALLRDFRDAFPDDEYECDYL
jgi:cytoskeletal protein RodZ